MAEGVVIKPDGWAVHGVPVERLESPAGEVVGFRVVSVVSPAEGEAIAHNLARYHQLQRLRRGEPNSYLSTSYR